MKTKKKKKKRSSVLTCPVSTVSLTAHIYQLIFQRGGSRDPSGPLWIRPCGGIRLRDLAPGQQSSEETSLRKRAVSDAVSDLTGLGFKPWTSGTDSRGAKQLNLRPGELPLQDIFSFFFFVVPVSLCSGLRQRHWYGRSEV